ncbi:hypothetical protein KM043_015743 [Ampulex compressa]|nr:hypothetical protein KM043_015743 [Ampulex compressa]
MDEYGDPQGIYTTPFVESASRCLKAEPSRENHSACKSENREIVDLFGNDKGYLSWFVDSRETRIHHLSVPYHG